MIRTPEINDYLVYFRDEVLGPWRDIYAARREADHLAAKCLKERRIYVVQVTDNGLVNVGFDGWNRKPFNPEAMA